MQSSDAGFTSARSSSVSLAQPRDTHDVVDDDRSIARELLQVAPHENRFLASNPVSLNALDRRQPRRPDTSADGFQDGRLRRLNRTSNTWTSSDGGLLSDQDEIDDRTIFIDEYNHLAKKHSVRVINDDWEQSNDDSNNLSPKGGWFRRILRRTSSSQSIKGKPDRQLKHRRSISDLSLRLKLKRDKLKDKDLQELVKLCGASILYLPAEYATGSLSVPTCFRATAQYLVQYGTSTRGIFRIPGSHNVVSALYNHFCSTDEYGQVISGTVRCPTLPEHIRCDVHDVASAFKKFLSGLPGGILGSLQLLDALISIQSQLAGQAELTRTKQSKVRARLIALAVLTLRSQYRRELICAVFGLLCMIGRIAETTHREDSRGRPLPTSDLMGYRPLGIVFGPLLVGDLLEDYTMRLADPHRGLVLLPISPPKSRKERRKKSKSGEEGSALNSHVDKIKVVNSITEMLITHWRDVVRHMRGLSALKNVTSIKSLAVRGNRQQVLRPSASESFALRKPPDWTDFKAPLSRRERSESPTPTHRLLNVPKSLPVEKSESLVVRKQRSGPRPMSSQRFSGARSISILSPTLEETSKDVVRQAIGQDVGIIRSADTSSGDVDGIEAASYVVGASSSIKEMDQILEPSSQEKSSRPPSSLHHQGSDNAAHAHSSTLALPVSDSSTSCGSEFAPPVAQNSCCLSTSAVTHSLPLTGLAFYTANSSLSLQVKGSNSPPRPSPWHSAIPPGFEIIVKPRVLTGAGDARDKSFSVNKSIDEEALTAKLNDNDDSEAQDTAEKAVLHNSTSSTQNASKARSALQRHQEENSPIIDNFLVSESREIRRLGVSEPGFDVIASKPDRRISRSMYENPIRKRNLIDWSKLPFQRDPLAKISKQEDADSLAVLAQAMNGELGVPQSLQNRNRISSIAIGDSTSDRKIGQESFQYSPNAKQTAKELSQIDNCDIIKSNAVSRRENRGSIVQFFQKDKLKEISDVGRNSSQHRSNLTHDIHIENQKRGRFGKALSKQVEHSKDSIQDSVTEQQNLLSDTQFRSTTNLYITKGSPKKLSAANDNSSSQAFKHLPVQKVGSPSKISALVARFDTHSAPLSPSKGSFYKTSIEAQSGIHREQPNSPGDSLLAPYTTNEPSPAKSQKSSKSDKAPYSRPSPASKVNTSKNGTAGDPRPPERPISGRGSTPKRMIRMSLYDPVPLRSTKQEPLIDNARSVVTDPELNGNSSTQLIRQSLESRNTAPPLTEPKRQTPANASTPTKQPGLVKALVHLSSSCSAPELNENSSGDLHRYGSSDKSIAIGRNSQYAIATGSISPGKNSRNLSLSTAVRMQIKPPKSFLSRLEIVRTASPLESLIDVPAFDGPGSVDDTAEGTPSLFQEAAPPAHNVPRARDPSLVQDARVTDFIHPDTPFVEAFTTSDLTASSSSPLNRREILLFKQIRNLRRQNLDISGQVRCLDDQVEILRRLDTQKSEELTTARKEVEFWKSKAEVAESKLEMVKSMPLIKHGGIEGLCSFPSLHLSTSQLFNEEYNGQVRSSSYRREMKEIHEHVTDDTGSPEDDEFSVSKRWGSEQSTGTVLRDAVIDGTEQSTWVGQSAESN